MTLSPWTRVGAAALLGLLCGAEVHAATVGIRGADAAAPLTGDRQRFLDRVDSLRVARRSAEADEEITRGIERARAGRDMVLLRELLVRLGLERASFGAGPEAEKLLREALAIAERTGDARTHLRALRWLVVAVSNQGRAEEAASLSESLLRVARAEGDRHYEGWALVGLGWDAIRRGDAAAGSTQSAAAAEIFRDLGDARSESWARNTLGIAQSAAGSYPAAMESYRRAAELASQAEYLLVEAMAHNNLGTLAYSLGDPGEASEQFRRARETHLRVGNPREAVFPAMNEALCWMELGRQEAAEARLDSLLEVSRARGYFDVEAKVLTLRAGLSSENDRPREAAAFYRRILALGRDVALKNRVEAVVGLSTLLARADSLPAALERMESIAPDLARVQGSELWIEWLAVRGAHLVEAGRPEEGLAALLQADRAADSLQLRGYRVRLLSRAARACRELGRLGESHERLEAAAAVWESERGAPLDPEWRESRGASGREIYTELAELLLDGVGGPRGTPGDRAERERAAFDRLQRFKARTLLERMRGPGAGNDSFASSSAAISLQELQAQTLRPGELLLDIYGGPRLTLAFAVTSDSVRVLRMPGDEDLRPALVSLRELLGTRPAAEDSTRDSPTQTAVHTLAARLLGGSEDLLARSTRVFVSPDGPFHLVPWEALAAELDDDRGLGKSRAGSGAATPSWSRVPSAGFLAELRRGRTVPTGRAGIGYVLSLGAKGEPPLPGAEREIRWIRREFRDVQPAALPEVMRRLERWSPDSLGASRPDRLPGGDPFGVLHVAGHITIRDQNPWQSEIRFGPEASECLRAEQVARVRLPARLVVLSGCTSAGGRTLSGEGVPGLATAFLVSGARAVVASLWPVEDEATTRLVTGFYRELARGAAVDGALARARERLRSDPKTRHPFYWAGFVVIGDGEQTVPMPRRPLWLPPLAAGAILLALLAFRRLRRRVRA